MSNGNQDTEDGIRSGTGAGGGDEPPGMGRSGKKPSPPHAHVRPEARFVIPSVVWLIGAGMIIAGALLLLLR